VDLRAEARSMQSDLAELRRKFHREPEIGLDLPHTQERVLEALSSLPLEIELGKSTTSVTAVLRGGRRAQPHPTTVLLRGDMDALPVDEEVEVDFAASNGAMHACGHDLHTAALIGAARILAQHREQLGGDVVFMFQPGEEGWDGAGAMISEGVLEAAGKRPDHAYALHVFSNRFPKGTFVSKPGTIMSASHALDVTVRGAGGHGSAPHTARDPITAAAQMVLALQTMITRSHDVFEPVVITVGVIQAGTRRNVIPDTARFEATVRRFSPESEQKLGASINRVLQGIAATHGVEVDIDFLQEYPITVNTPSEVGYAAQVIRESLGDERFVELDKPISASEDFSRVLEAVPGAFIGLGACMPDLDPATAPMNHSPRAQFDDGVLGDAAAVYAGLAVHRLQQADAEGAAS
jgi:amidohydrolase